AQALPKAAWLSADRGIAPRGDGGGGLVDGTGEDGRGVRGQPRTDSGQSGHAKNESSDGTHEAGQPF
ncbi:MAG: hypothetical protein KDD83_09035, partial [Caldilineaceae bacterium]|nr:hypothetical protein [Caldilineaceae bacterium]